MLIRKNRQERNMELEQKDLWPLPDEAILNQTLTCTHAGKWRQRGTGQRGNREVRTCECKAKVKHNVYVFAFNTIHNTCGM